jgi:2,4'-dihydroxyacetophenone dioxygenase
MTFEPARPLDTDGMPWIPTGPGKSFRPLRFAADGWSELMRLEPGSAVALHRHSGDVHAFNLAGTRSAGCADPRLTWRPNPNTGRTPP